MEKTTLDSKPETGGLKGFDASLEKAGLYPLKAAGIETMQVNLGRLCNQTCRHCHVDAGPKRTEVMPRSTMEVCLEKMEEAGIRTIDITGGAPEMNPDYRWLVKNCRGLGYRVMTRTNLTIILEQGYADLPSFFAENNVEVIASLPYYLEEVTDRQRGAGIFAKSVEALGRLNAVGYGQPEKNLTLSLVYNPCGAFLPPPQKTIEADFRRELKRRHDIEFTNLFTITNMPIGRFLDFLKTSGNLKQYQARLHGSYNPEAASNVMCREILSVGWDGSLYDCDFNQMLGLKCNHGAPEHIRAFKTTGLARRKIVTGAHCYGCTAGSGSSCTGAVAG
jgi:radical SAM/Cys-rich protein